MIKLIEKIKAGKSSPMQRIAEKLFPTPEHRKPSPPAMPQWKIVGKVNSDVVSVRKAVAE